MVDVLVCSRVTTEEKYTYTVCVPVMKEEKRMVTVCTPVMKEVAYTFTVMVPHTEQRKVQCTTYQCVKEMVVEKVPVCKVVCVTCVDECGRCHTHRERVTVMEEQTRCVVKAASPDRHGTSRQRDGVHAGSSYGGMKTVCGASSVVREGRDGQGLQLRDRICASAPAWCAAP